REDELVQKGKDKVIETMEEVVIREMEPQKPYWGGAKISTKVIRHNVVVIRDVLGTMEYEPKKTYFETKSGQRTQRLRLYPGENWLTFEIQGQEYIVKVLVVKNYGDVDQGVPGYAEIQSLTMIGVFNGYRGNRGMFEPYAKVDIGEFELAISNLLHGQSVGYEAARLRRQQITRKDAIRMLVDRFGGSRKEYLSVLPKQVEADISDERDSGYLHRYEMAQLLAKTGKAKDQVGQISSDYGVVLGEIYVTGTYEDL
ncbi:hypothetical protein ACFL5G_05455, partial [Candidatus Margulisiibacteriota bacterium]